jgi:hypothetical protein
MKTLIKFGGEIILATILFIFLYVGVNKYYSLRKEYNNLKTTYELTQESSLQYRKLVDSTIVAYTKTKVVTEETAKILFKEELDKYKKETNRAIKDLQSLTKATVVTNNEFTLQNIQGCDSLNIKHADKFSEINVNVKDGVAVVDSKQYLYLTKYTYDVRNKAKWYKPWKWGKHLQTDLKSENPNDSIINLNEILIK